MSDSYDDIRQRYRPDTIKFLIIAESPPPPANYDGSRHFYRSDRPRRDDRLFVNTIRALYPETADTPEADLETAKERWLRRFQSDGWYMIEALEDSQPHGVTKRQRQVLIKDHLPNLLERVAKLATDSTRIILVKSNVFEVAAEPLREAGFNVLNQRLVDYPGHYNQEAYRQKLAKLASQ